MALRPSARAAAPVVTHLDRRNAVLLMLVTVLLWSTSGLFVKLSALNPIALAGGRSLLTAIVLLIWLRRPRFTWSRAQVGGALCMAATFFLFISATRLTSAANAILLQYTAPVWVAVFGQRYLGKRTRADDWWLMGIIAFGMLLFFGDQLTRTGMVGNMLAIASGLTLGWMTLLLWKQRYGEVGETILLGNIFTAVIGVPFLLVAVLQGQVAPVEWGILLYMGVIQLAIPFILYTVAIRSLEALETSLISTLEPILNPIWVFLVVGERPGLWTLAGGLVVICAVTVRALIAAGIIGGAQAQAPASAQE